MNGVQFHAYVHLCYGLDAEAYRARYAAGLEPDATPYGFHHAQNDGFDVSFSHDAQGTIFELSRRVARRILGFDVSHAFSNRRHIRKADVVWTMTEPEAFAVCLLMRLGVVPRKPMVANAVWLLNEWDTLPWWRQRLIKSLLREISVLTVHSERCIPLAKQVAPKYAVQLNYFGINADLFWQAATPKLVGNQPVRIFAPGNDRTRDWETLLAAFGNDERFDIKLACGWISNDLIKRYNNVALLRKPSMKEFLQAYIEADFVAVPMVENVFSGITVALEAVAVGRPVLCSRTGGVPSYFDEKAAFYTPVGDAAAMRQTVLDATPETVRTRIDAARRTFNERGYSTRAVMARYATISRKLLFPSQPLSC